jgi:hypothetical protein
MLLGDTRWRKRHQKGWGGLLHFSLLYFVSIGRNSPCYSQSPLPLCLEISISSNSGNLLQLYTVKKKGGKPDRKPHLLPYGLRNPSKTSSLRTFKNTPRTLKKLYVHEFGFVTEKEKEEKEHVEI